MEPPGFRQFPHVTSSPTGVNLSKHRILCVFSVVFFFTPHPHAPRECFKVYFLPRYEVPADPAKTAPRNNGAIENSLWTSVMNFTPVVWLSPFNFVSPILVAYYIMRFLCGFCRHRFYILLFRCCNNFL